MGYELREITAADQQKILQDFEKYDIYAFKVYSARIDYNLGYFPAKTWAVNDKKTAIYFIQC